MEGDFDLNVCEGDYDMCIYIYMYVVIPILCGLVIM